MNTNNYNIIDSSIMYKILLDLNRGNEPNLRGLIWGNYYDVICAFSYKVYEYLQDNDDFVKCYNDFRKEFKDTKDLMEIADILNSKSADEFMEKISDMLDVTKIRKIVIDTIIGVRGHRDEIESFYHSIYPDNEYNCLYDCSEGI